MIKKYKGTFRFDGKNHPGECEVDSNNNIKLRINESDINGYKEQIKGVADNTSLDLYECKLIGNDIGYYLYSVAYLVDKEDIRFGKTDFNKHIYDFRFTFEPLEYWLDDKILNITDKSIEWNIPEDIIIYSKKNLEIKIKYFKGEDIINNKIAKFEIIPYVCVKSSKKLNIDNIMYYVQLITRFFSLLCGYSGQVNELIFHKYYNGKIIFDTLEDSLIINTDFSNFNDISIAYNERNLRTYYKEFGYDKLVKMFNIWFELYSKKYKMAFVNYFNPYSAKTIESEFLRITKSIEKASICGENQKEKKKKSRKLDKVLSDFYNNYKSKLIESMKNNKFKKDYVKNIEKIHKGIIDSVVYGYENRKTLSDRLKEFDVDDNIKNHFREKHIINSDSKKTNVYEVLANTRNYYTHLDKNTNIMDEKYLVGYNRILEKNFIQHILKLIIEDDLLANKIVNKDNYLTIYDNRE